MPPKMGKGAVGDNERKQPTAQEAYLFYTIIKNMKGKPDVDWNAVAADAGFKNADTAKVRYGQIKRKLGVDNWNARPNLKEPKEEDGGEGGVPVTPAAARTRKSAATPSGTGTGAGVKKRTASARRATDTTTPGSRARRAKARAIIKIEEGIEQVLDFEDDEEEAEQPEIIETPTKKQKKEKRAGGGGIKVEFPPVPDTPARINPGEFANFPAVLPSAVIERKAILVKSGSIWTTSPASVEKHGQWLSKLPAHLQTRFYGQAQRIAAGAAAGNSNRNSNDNREISFSFETVMAEANDDTVVAHNTNNIAAATIAAPVPLGPASNNHHFISEHFNNAMAGMDLAMAPLNMPDLNNMAMNMPYTMALGGTGTGMGDMNIQNMDMNMSMGMNMNMNMGMGMGMDYLSGASGAVNTANTANTNAANGAAHGSEAQAATIAATIAGATNAAGEVDLHSIPMHPSYLAQLQQEVRDREVLFGGGNYGREHGDGEDDIGLI